MTQPLDEKPSLGDTMKTSAKALGSRLGHGLLATAGNYLGTGHKARGRLAVRIMADRMLKGWRAYEGGSGRPATRENVLRFLDQHWGNTLDQDTLQNIMKGSQSQKSPPPAPRRQPDVEPQMNLPLGSPAAKPPSRPAPPVGSPTRAPVSNAPPIVPAPAPPAPVAQPATTADGRQQVTPQQYQAAMRMAGGNPNRITPEMLNRAVQEVPATVAPKSPPAQTPAPTPAPEPAPEPAEPSEPAAELPRRPPPAQPVPEPAAEPAAEPQHPVSITRGVVNQLNALMHGPHFDQSQAMQAISNGIQQTRPGTPPRQQMIDLIRMLQTSSRFSVKLPQIKQIVLPESRGHLGRLLREYANDVLSRSELDGIFKKVAQELIAVGAVSLHGKHPQGRNTPGPSSSEPAALPASPLDKYLDSTITLQNFVRATVALRPVDRTTVTTIAHTLHEMTGIITVKRLLKTLKDKDERMIASKLSASAIDTLIRAVELSNK